MFAGLLFLALIAAVILVPRFQKYIRDQELAAQRQTVALITEPPLFADEFQGDTTTIERRDRFLELFRESGNRFFRESDIPPALHYYTPRKNDVARIPFNKWKLQVQENHDDLMEEFRQELAAGFEMSGDNVRYRQEIKRTVLHNQRGQTINLSTK